MSLDDLIAEDRAIDFDHFGHRDAWAVGSDIVRMATERSLPITVAIWLGEQRVFHVGMQGSSADNDHWMERKAAMVRRYDASSLLTNQRWQSRGVHEESLRIGLDPRLYTFSGGGVPVRVHGALVGVAVVSGLTEDADHALVIESLRNHLATQPTE
jgi:uncharacterized protein (UPF0303 family)